MIDLSLLRGVQVDGDARIARAEGGATWADSVVGGTLVFGGRGVRDALGRFRDVVASLP